MKKNKSCKNKTYYKLKLIIKKMKLKNKMKNGEKNKNANELQFVLFCVRIGLLKYMNRRKL